MQLFGSSVLSSLLCAFVLDKASEDYLFIVAGLITLASIAIYAILPEPICYVKNVT